MKLSQRLTEIKQKEGELLRLLKQRQEVIESRMKNTEYLFKGKDSKEIEEITKKFIEEKKKKFNAVNEQINKAKKELIEMKSEVNKKNIELNLDQKLLEVKWIRIELSKLMKSLDKDAYSIREMDTEEAKSVGVLDYIKLLEKQKNKIDSNIQQINWTNEI